VSPFQGPPPGDFCSSSPYWNFFGKEQTSVVKRSSRKSNNVHTWGQCEICGSRPALREPRCFIIEHGRSDGDAIRWFGARVPK
jgi:hypothetical protein